MSTDSKAARVSVQRTASVSRNNLQSAILFAEPPVALPNLDELRAADVLVRAYYDTLVKPTALSPSPVISLPIAALSAAPAAPTEETEAVAPSVVVAEQRAAAESIGAALARVVVESAAQLYTSRRLDDLVETYTACATWDDARDVVAGSFLPQDLCGSGLNRELPGAHSTALPALSGGGPQATAVPLFLRSALSLAGVATRTPTSTLTPQSSLAPPPLGTTVATAPRGTRQIALHDTWGPEPPACVPMDAYARYVTVVEEAPALLSAAEHPSSLQRTAAARPRVAKGKAKAAEATTTAAGGAAAAAAATTAAATLSPSPPAVANAPGKRGGRMLSKSSPQLPQTPPQLLEASHMRGRTLLGATAQPPTEDPLTRALRLGGASAAGDGGAARPDRNTARSAGSPLSAVIVAGAEAERKTGAKPTPRAGGAAAGAGAGGSTVVVSVEQDRLVATDRGAKTLQRGGQRKDGVRCRVLPGEGSGGATQSPRAEEATDERGTGAPAEADGDAAGPQRDGKRSLPKTGTKSAAAAKSRKLVPAEQEAWTASFFNATDAAGEASLLDQVQVSPSPGVTVVGGLAPPSNAQSARRGHKGGAAANAVVHGGEFTVPADRLALSAFEEKRVAGRKPNGGLHNSSPAKPRATPAFKTL